MNYDDLFNNGNNNIPEPPPEPINDDFDTAEWAAKKKQEREDAYALIDETALELKTPEALKEYLDIQSRFNLYSVGNLLLIQAQMPTAVKLKDYDGWKAAGTTVRKNQQAISILEPGKQYTRNDGDIGTSMNVKKVFNISQTYAKPEKKPPAEINRTVIKALMNRSPVKIIASDDMRDGVNAFFDFQNERLVIRKGMDAPVLFRHLSEMTAFAKFYYNDRVPAENANFKAKCVSYVLCRQYGVNVSDYKFDDLPSSFDTNDPHIIRGELTAVRDTVDTFNKGIRDALAQAKRDPDQGER